jgi:hypothetical protein
MLLTALLISVVTAISHSTPDTMSPPAEPIVDLCEVRVRSSVDALRVMQAASDFDDHYPISGSAGSTSGTVRVYADAAEQARLRGMGFDLTVVQRDIAAFYVARAASDVAKPAQGGSMGGFKTLAEIGTELDFLSTTYPAIVSPKFSIGTSIQGRPIWAVRISKTPLADDPTKPVAWFDALHHAREPMSAEAELLLAEDVCAAYPADSDTRRMVETRNIVIVPCVNPDGYAYNQQTNPNGGGLWRKNRRNNGDGTFGVDLNRNYGYQWGPQWPGSSGQTNNDTYRGTAPFSEPETQAVRDAMLAHPPGMVFSAHTYSDLWLFPWGYTSTPSPGDATFRTWSQIMTASNGWVYGPPPLVLYVCNGVTIDWSYGVLGSVGFSPEIGSTSDGFWPTPSRIQPLYQSVKPGMLESIEWSGGWADVISATFTQFVGNGNSIIDPGEVWDVTVHFENQGVAPVVGVMELSSTTANVAVISDSTSFAIGATTFTPTVHAGGVHRAAHAHSVPLRIAISPTAPSGNYALDLALTYSNVTTSSPITVHVGP